MSTPPAKTTTTTKTAVPAFTLEPPEAYRFFARGIDQAELTGQPWHVRVWRRCRAFFMAFTARLSPASR